MHSTVPMEWFDMEDLMNEVLCDRVIVRPEKDHLCHLMEQITYFGLYPVLFIFGTCGNMLNLLVYRQQLLSNSGPMAFLRFKALTNILVFFTLIPNFLHVVQPFQDTEEKETIYWNIKIYAVWLTNCCQSVATWCTVAIISQAYWCLIRPISFKSFWHKHRNMSWAIVAFFALVIIIIESVFITTHHVHIEEVINNPEISHGNHSQLELLSCLPVQAHFTLSVSSQSYFWIHSGFIICTPIFLMNLLCGLIYHNSHRVRMHSKRWARAGVDPTQSKTRRCVTRLSIVTALAHLCLEGPGLFPFLAAAYNRNWFNNLRARCVISDTTNLLALINSAIPFYLYSAINKDFFEVALNGIHTCWNQPERRSRRSRRRMINLQYSNTMSSNGLSVMGLGRDSRRNAKYSASSLGQTNFTDIPVSRDYQTLRKTSPVRFRKSPTIQEETVCPQYHSVTPVCVVPPTLRRDPPQQLTCETEVNECRHFNTRRKISRTKRVSPEPSLITNDEIKSYRSSPVDKLMLASRHSSNSSQNSSHQSSAIGEDLPITMQILRAQRSQTSISSHFNATSDEAQIPVQYQDSYRKIKKQRIRSEADSLNSNQSCPPSLVEDEATALLHGFKMSKSPSLLGHKSCQPPDFKPAYMQDTVCTFLDSQNCGGDRISIAAVKRKSRSSCL